MRQQERVHDDNQHVVQLNRGDYEEVDHEGASHEEIDHDHQEVFDEEEDGRRCFAVCLTDSYSLTATFAAVGGRYDFSARVHLIDGRPR
jgi:hypothetical protein